MGLGVGSEKNSFYCDVFLPTTIVTIQSLLLTGRKKVCTNHKKTKKVCTNHKKQRRCVPTTENKEGITNHKKTKKVCTNHKKQRRYY